MGILVNEVKSVNDVVGTSFESMGFIFKVGVIDLIIGLLMISLGVLLITEEGSISDLILVRATGLIVVSVIVELITMSLSSFIKKSLA